ncbi:unnamed protein product [Rotaria socialis]|uniref:Uncharacterized protein n=1 Tax=Rotaria socialis TaxID=392032 RepID=A0A817MVD5_9BILA|nr:unnamed protein product [Rotaria socialis]CAF3390621.1 unnamed protein product [Rotaria socialis]CAF3447952.1 unnamed protein product [Rotaria socialis]CAF3450829.1 unnamed protein product [Rotaria socialis]CAF3482773.1 unnamed protein product [Rotaria socialis]
MPKSDFDFTFKFFHPPHRTVPFRNGLLDTRTKHTIAQDRLVVAEQRLIDAERRKSTTSIQLLAFEQKRLEKRLESLCSNLDSNFTSRPLKMRGRSTSEVIFRNIRRTSSLAGSLAIHNPKLSVSLYSSNQNLLALPKLDDIERRSSTYSDGDTTENTFSTSDMDSGEEVEHKVRKKTKTNRKITYSRRIVTKKKTLPKLVFNQNKLSLPIVAVIPPEEDVLFLTQ